MYAFLRNTHLILGLVFSLALVIYGVSSVRIARPSWFSNEPTILERTLKVEPSMAADGRTLGLALMNEHGLRGELFRVERTSDGFELGIRRPGTNYEVRYSRLSGEAFIRTRKQNFMGMLTSLHVAGGLWHEHWLTNVWGVVLALTSLGLFLLGGTGIYLWFQIHEQRVVGSILLGAGLVWGVTMIILTRQIG